MIETSHLIPDLNKDIFPSKEAAGISLGMAFNKFRSHALFRDVRREEYESNQEKNMWLVFHRHELLPWQEWINEIYCSWENSFILTFDGNSKKLMLYT